VETSDASRPCPACGQPLYGWLQLDTPVGKSLLQRCESCRLGIAADLRADDVSHELIAGARTLPGGELELRVANRGSIQAALGGFNWAALEPGRGLYPTRAALRHLAGRAGLELVRVETPRWGQGQVWTWQTIVNAFTFNQNFATRARARMLHARGARDRLKFALDALVTALATPLVLLVSVPLELIAALAGRGGLLVALATRSDEPEDALP
jgi:hypothetical protein